MCAAEDETNVNIRETLTLLKGYAYRLTGEHSRPKVGRVELVPRAKCARTPPRASERVGGRLSTVDPYPVVLMRTLHLRVNSPRFPLRRKRSQPLPTRRTAKRHHFLGLGVTM